MDSNEWMNLWNYLKYFVNKILMDFFLIIIIILGVCVWVGVWVCALHKKRMLEALFLHVVACSSHCVISIVGLQLGHYLYLQGMKPENLHRIPGVQKKSWL